MKQKYRDARCFNPSRRYPKHWRDEELKRILQGDIPPQIQLIARRIAKRTKAIGYLSALEILVRVGAVLAEVEG